MARDSPPDIALLEKLKDRPVASVCDAVIQVAAEFNSNYLFRNDVQHVGANIAWAVDLKKRVGRLKVEDLVQQPEVFGDFRRLLRQVLQPRGLVAPGHSVYARDPQFVEYAAYANPERFLLLA